VLRFYEDLPYDRIAEILECPVGTVRSRIHRGLADLRKEMER
jgi:RNA polymerase sigma-70 factor (ECF subfamily)